MVAAIGGASPAQQHDLWRPAKRDDGWTFGLLKDSVAKTHPCLDPFDRLPEDQKVKDVLFHAIMGALSRHPADSGAGRLPQRHAAVAAQAGDQWMAEHAPHLASAGDTSSYRFQQLCVQLGLFVADYDAREHEPAPAGQELPRRVPAVPVQIEKHPAVPRVTRAADGLELRAPIELAPAAATPTA